MVVKSNIKATPVEIEQLKNLLKGVSFYNLALRIGVSDYALKSYYNGKGVTERMASCIKSFLRRQPSVKDNVIISAIQELENLSNLVITKGDTSQRETFLECIEEIEECLKLGKQVSLQEKLSNLKPCVLKLI